ncbi:GLPGLI family protein [Daejeonella sp.]|uniref:GLPGLI family protein n=1 Tax=Daejeonella sp. TaxID=2805397 RepID=UPI00271BF78B|nr:GLPGLI family protein [Daejeonella sp.]MDO8994791.1 GLPGLI family protein [Daejeonella sp.]MDP2414023.1 GLPGLI family protein [Daejeonella sp.]
MKRTILFFTLLQLILLFNPIFAQHARFATEGIIEFEKSVNMHAQIKKYINKDNEAYYIPAFEQYKKTKPQFRVLKSTLTFSKDKTLFSPAPADESDRGWFSDIPATTQNNIIYTDLSTNTSIVQKTVFEETFLVRDSTRKINWKITSETRDIAGYSCRRANAIIMDSIYVVAFYTDEIPVSGGPESFTGLPGMILGVALPHENMSWFAKLVTDKSLPSGSLIAPKKGKATDNKGLLDTLMKVMKNWGTYAQHSLKSFMM